MKRHRLISLELLQSCGAGNSNIEDNPKKARADGGKAFLYSVLIHVALVTTIFCIPGRPPNELQEAMRQVPPTPIMLRLNWHSPRPTKTGDGKRVSSSAALRRSFLPPSAATAHQSVALEVPVERVSMPIIALSLPVADITGRLPEGLTGFPVAAVRQETVHPGDNGPEQGFPTAASPGLGREQPRSGIKPTGFPVARIPTAVNPEAQNALELPDTAFHHVKIGPLPTPDYPADARNLGISGTVKIAVVVQKDGQPGEISVVGDRLGHGLDEAAIEAVKAIDFEAARRGNQTVAETVVFRISFDLAHLITEIAAR